MKTQTADQNCTIPHSFYELPALRSALAGSKLAELILVLSFLTLLATATAWGQCTPAPTCPNPNNGPSSCQTIGRFSFNPGCPSLQYRLDQDHTGNAQSDVLNCPVVKAGCLQLDFSNTTGGLPVLPPGLTSSPSVNLDSRDPFNSDIIFAAQGPPSSACGGGNVWGLWAYGTQGGNYRWDTITQGTNICMPIRSSPGLFTAPGCPPTESCQQFVFAGGEDGNLYAFNLADGTLLWTYMANGSIDASPTVSVANEVYIIDEASYVHKVDGNTGMGLWTNGPILITGMLFADSPPTSIALSTCGGQSCLIAAGSSCLLTPYRQHRESLGSATGSAPQPPLCSPPYVVGLEQAYSTTDPPMLLWPFSYSSPY
ncbi:MAG: hypothetical protein ABSD98_16410, partial [Candidatus Korobacteraceae bacterium]